MTYAVIVQPQAEHEFDVLYSYIAKRSRRGAIRWANAYFAMLSKLQDNPERFSLAPESALHDEAIRQVIFGTRHGLPYRALFLIRSEVRVIHLRGPGQDHLTVDQLQLP